MLRSTRNLIFLVAATLVAAGCGAVPVASAGNGTETLASRPDDGGSTADGGAVGGTATVDGVAGPGFPGRILLDEYEWFLDPTYRGVIEVSGESLGTVRLLDGRNPRRLDDDRIVYLRSCGAGVHQAVVADADLRVTEVSPCSSERVNPGASPTRFYFPSVDPSGRWVAIQSEYYLDGAWQLAVDVYATGSHDQVASFDNVANPVWLPDGRLLTASGDWFWTTAPGSWVLERLPGELTGPVANPAISPDGRTIAFEYNQQIWGAGVDGSEARALVLGDGRLRFPAWSPDGTTIAYLSTPVDDQFTEALFFVDIETQEVWAVDFSERLAALSTFNGPLSWTW